MVLRFWHVLKKTGFSARIHEFEHPEAGLQTQYAMHQNLLPSKLSPPRPPPFQLPRAQLGGRINDARDVRLIVLRAPAGFGKTTAMLQYAARRQAAGAVVRWFNLDASDNDLGRFLAHFDAAIESVAPRADAASGEPSLLELIDRVAASGAAFTMFLDDFEVVESSAVLDLIRQLVDHLPSGLAVRDRLACRARPRFGTAARAGPATGNRAGAVALFIGGNR